MSEEEFQPTSDRPPREKLYEEETEQIINKIRNRGDQRIGQLIINAISKSSDLPEPPSEEKLEKMKPEDAVKKIEQYQKKRKGAIEQRIWSMEADTLLEYLENFK